MKINGQIMRDKKSDETHAEVISDMRECNGYRAYYDSGLHHDSYEESVVSVDYLHDFADRAEAAHKREIEEAERRGNHSAMKAVCETIEKVGPLYDADSIGDSVKLREALEDSNELLDELAKLGEWWDSAKDQIEANNVALAAPARNCDRFHTENDTMIAFLNEVWLISVDTLDNDPFDEWTPQMKARYARWLLEKKENVHHDNA